MYFVASCKIEIELDIKIEISLQGFYVTQNLNNDIS